MSPDEVASHPAFVSNGGPAVAALYEDMVLQLQRECGKRVPMDGGGEQERLAEVGRRVLIYDEILAVLHRHADPKSTPTVKPARKRLNNQDF